MCASKWTLSHLKMLPINYDLQIIYLIYKYKEDLVLNSLQELICHKTQPTIMRTGVSPVITEVLIIKYSSTAYTGDLLIVVMACVVPVILFGLADKRRFAY